MAFCSDCGVEIEEGHRTCPLCLHELGTDTEEPLPVSQAYARQRETVATPKDLMRRRWGVVVAILSALLAIPALVCVLVDVLYQGGGWSRFVVASLALAWWLGFTPRLFFRNTLVICLSDVGLVALFLFVIDFMDAWQGWALTLGLPIAGGTALVVVLLWLALRLYARHTGFVLATLFGTLAILCLVIDAAVNWWLRGEFHILWSLIALAAFVPLTLVSVIMQLVFSRSSRLQRYLHL